MSSKKIVNLNNYTLIESTDIDKIYFYPIKALTNVKVTQKKDDICILFEIKKETSSYNMHCSLLNSDNVIVFKSYSILLKEIGLNKYVVVSTTNDLKHAEILPSCIIDFNNLNYNNFIEILKNNEDLSKMIPDLMSLIKKSVNSLREEQKVVEKIDIPSPLNYYKNITGYTINYLEEIISKEDELDISNKILKNIRKNFDVVLNEKNQNKLAYISLYGIILKNVKSIILKPKDIMDSKELKPDTNKTSIKSADLKAILNSYINNLIENKKSSSEEDIIEERIEYIITSKPRLKEFTNFIKIILMSDKYTDTSKRTRLIKEIDLKELVLDNISGGNYFILPRNQVLIYNNIEEITDFICIISIDKIYNLLKTYRLNSEKENKSKIDLLKTLDNIISDNQTKITEKNIQISILILIMIHLYYYKNVNENNLLFYKDEYILKLDYKKGNYDIFAINRHTEKKVGHLIKIADETKDLIKSSLSKSEKSFNVQINKIIYNNLIEALNNLAIDIDIKELSHRGITIRINRVLKKDIFNFSLPLDSFLTILTSIQKQKEVTKIEIPEIEDIELKEEKTKYNLPLEEYEYIIRKSNTIKEIMEKESLDNVDYQEITALYNKFTTSPEKEKEAILRELQKHLNK